MEDVLNLTYVFTDCDMHDLSHVIESFHHMREQRVIGATLLDCHYSRTLLPDVIVFAQCSRILVLSDQKFLFSCPQIKHHLFWLQYCSPHGWVEACFYKVVGKLEYLLIMLLYAVAEVLAELLDSVSDFIVSPPSPVVIQLELIEIFALVHMLNEELTEVYRIPVS